MMPAPTELMTVVVTGARADEMEAVAIVKWPPLRLLVTLLLPIVLVPTVLLLLL